MPKLRASSIAQIYNAVECSSFGLASFDIKFPDDKNDVAVITFLPRSKFYFRIGISQGSQEHIYVRVCPGEYKSEDFQSMHSFESCLAQILPWIHRISEDLRVLLPDLSDLAQFREALEAHIKSAVADEDQPFSSTEIEEIDSKLSSLEQRLKELEERHVLAEQELAQLRQAVTQARSDLPAYPKGVWYRTAGGKLWEVMKKVGTSKEAREVLTAAAKKLLGI